MLSRRRSERASLAKRWCHQCLSAAGVIPTQGLQRPFVRYHESPMPFGCGCYPDTELWRQTLERVLESPMPFGCGCYPDFVQGQARKWVLSVTNAFRLRVLSRLHPKRRAAELIGQTSPMPFGCGCYPDEDVLKWCKDNGYGHQCLSAAGVIPTK